MLKGEAAEMVKSATGLSDEMLTNLHPGMEKLFENVPKITQYQIVASARTMETDMSKANSQIRIRKAGRNHLDTLINVLVRAHDQAPHVNWLVPKDEKRSQRIAIFFEILVNHCGKKYDHAFTPEDLSDL